MAFFLWQQQGREWVAGIASDEEMPERLRGPFRWHRIQEERVKGQDLPSWQPDGGIE